MGVSTSLDTNGLWVGLPQLALRPRPRPFAEPFGDDILPPLAHLHPVMERVGVDGAVRANVIPGEQLARLGLVQLAGRQKARRAARTGLVEVNHQRPAALPRNRAIGLPVGAVRVEIIGVRLELLPDVVALTLHRLAICERNAGEIVELVVDRDDQRIAVVEIAGGAGAEGLVTIGVGDRRWPHVAVDLCDQSGAGFGVEKAGQHILFELGRWRTADAGNRGEPRRGAVGARGRHIDKIICSHGARFSREVCANNA